MQSAKGDKPSTDTSLYGDQYHDLAALCLKGEPELNTSENVDDMARCIYLEIEFMRMRAALRKRHEAAPTAEDR